MSSAVTKRHKTSSSVMRQFMTFFLLSPSCRPLLDSPEIKLDLSVKSIDKSKSGKSIGEPALWSVSSSSQCTQRFRWVGRLLVLWLGGYRGRDPCTAAEEAHSSWLWSALPTSLLSNILLKVASRSMMFSSLAPASPFQRQCQMC